MKVYPIKLKIPDNIIDNHCKNDNDIPNFYGNSFVIPGGKKSNFLNLLTENVKSIKKNLTNAKI